MENQYHRHLMDKQSIKDVFIEISQIKIKNKGIPERFLVNSQKIYEQFISIIF